MPLPVRSLNLKKREKRIIRDGVTGGMRAPRGSGIRRATKYRTRMGLDLPDMAAWLPPVKSVAVTGGDPLFPLGTDVAVLFETGKPAMLYQALLRGIEHAVADETYRSTYHNRLDGNLSLVESSDDEGHTIHDNPELDLPAELIAGMIGADSFSTMTSYKDPELGEERISASINTRWLASSRSRCLPGGLSGASGWMGPERLSSQDFMESSAPRVDMP